MLVSTMFLESAILGITGFSLIFLPQLALLRILLSMGIAICIFLCLIKGLVVAFGLQGHKRFFAVMAMLIIIPIYCFLSMLFFGIAFLFVHFGEGRTTAYHSPSGQRTLVFIDQSDFNSCYPHVYERRGWLRRKANLKIISDTSNVPGWHGFEPCNVFHDRDGLELRWHEDDKAVSWKARVENYVGEDVVKDDFVKGIVIFD
ncbi:MAG: hypothetical protein AAF685_10445 [Cyanobacteria bacterium P01_C01_bin.89]